MTENDRAGSTPPGEEPALPRQDAPDTSQPAGDPGYLTETGEAVGEDGSVAPIIVACLPSRVRPGISAPRGTSAVRTWLTSRSAERTRIDQDPPPASGRRGITDMDGPADPEPDNHY